MQERILRFNEEMVLVFMGLKRKENLQKERNIEIFEKY